MNTTQRRFQEHFRAGPQDVVPLAPDHPAVVHGRTVFRKSVVSAVGSPRLLVSGHNQRKIGKTVLKGAWKGMPIFCLTLEERRTCPRTCHHWNDCYGGAMPFARRHIHGRNLEYLLHAELAAMSKAQPAGFVVRLHILGDFYDLAYVMLWHRWLARFKALRVFGYTAHDRWSLIGRAIDEMNLAFPGRAAIRFSTPYPDGDTGGWATTIAREPEAAVVAEGIVCPAQTGATDCCGTCGLCWAPAAYEKTIVFVLHGRKTRGHGTASHKDQATTRDPVRRAPAPSAAPPEPAPAVVATTAGGLLAAETS